MQELRSYGQPSRPAGRPHSKPGRPAALVATRLAADICGLRGRVFGTAGAPRLAAPPATPHKRYQGKQAGGSPEAASSTSPSGTSGLTVSSALSARIARMIQVKEEADK